MTLARWLAVASLAAIGLATLKPQATSSDLGHLCFICGEYGTVDAILNVVLFAPLGIALARSGMRPATAILAGCLCSMLIELAQLFVVPGRNANIGDVAMNTLGTAVGFALGVAGRRPLLPHATLASRLLAAWIGLWVTLQLLSGYSFMAMLPEPPYYRHFNRPPAQGRDAFAGVVLSASVNGKPLAAPLLDNAQRLKTWLRQPQGTTIRAVVVASGVAPSAEIFNVSGPGMEDLFGFDQLDRSFVFGLRTGADALRLRPHAYRLADVFDADARPDTIVLLARHTSSGVVLSATAGGRTHGQQLSRELSSGWRLFLPIPTYIDGGRFGVVAAIAYMMLLSAPAGYWSAFVSPEVNRRRAALLGAATALVLMTGLAVVARQFALRPPPPWEYLSVGVGVVMGLLIGLRVVSLFRRNNVAVSPQSFLPRASTTAV